MTATVQQSTKAQSYIDSVLSGNVIASEWVTLQIKNHADDLIHGHERGLRFNLKRGLHVIRFVEAYIKGTVDKYDGKPYILEPWEAALLLILYGWEWSATGLRRYKVAYCEIARGNKKSTLASALLLYDLLVTPGANGYSASSGKDTAKIVFDTASAMVQKSAPLRKLITGYRDNLHIKSKGSKCEPCSAEAKTIFKASRPSFVVLDELHLHPNADVWTAFFTALNKREESMLFAITNSGWDRHSVCWQQREYSIKVLNRVVPDDTWFSWICGLSEKDDWEDERNWIKANPSLGSAVSLDGLRRFAIKAKEDPASLNEFLRFPMCVWTESHSVWMPMDKWTLCDEPVVAEMLKGRQCFGGLDLSSSGDITAFLLLFPPFGDDKLWRVLPFFFLPKDNITKRVKQDKVPYDVWERQGLFTLIEGNVIDEDVVRAKINDLAAQYKIVEIAYDPFNARQIITQLQSDGLTVVPFRQGDVSMNAPMRRLMELVLRGEITHGGNPVLKWMAGNTVAKIGATGLMKPDKEKSREKIDGISALLDALGRAMLFNNGARTASDIYESRDIRTL